MNKINSNYSLAIQYWNRNQIEEARKYFNMAMSELDLLDSYDKKNLIEFYTRVDDRTNLIKILEYMINNEEGLHWVINQYLRLVGDRVRNEDLIKFEKIRQIRLDKEVIYNLALAHYKKGNYIKSYTLFTDLLDLVEGSCKNDLNKELYVSSVLKVIELEYSFNNFVQARMQLRKLICKNFDIENNLRESIIYWSIVLNIFYEVLNRKEWTYAIKNIDDKELKLLVYVMSKIYIGKINKSVFGLLSSSVFEDINLKYRVDVIKIYLKKCSNDLTWKEDIEKIDIKKCFLAILMEYEKRKAEESFESKGFLKEHYKYHSDIPQIINTFWNRETKKESKPFTDVSIQFVGGANGIGGSSVLVTYKGTKILLDAGANINSSEFIPNFKCMEEQKINLKDIDYLIISHGHLDHIGASPYVYNINPNIKIIATSDTKDIMKVMLEDTAKINERKGIDIFDVKDVKNLISNIDIVEFEKEIKLTKDISLVLYRAGHILGAASIYLKLGETTVLYTGDYSITDQYTVSGLKLPEAIDVDILITESTYAYHPINFELDRAMQERMLVEEILQVTNEGGVVLVPAFAVGRAQEIVLLIKEYFKDETFLPFDLYIDGKVVEICSIYETSNESKLEEDIYGKGVTTVNDRYKGKNEIPISKFRGSCIIASSGMLNENSRSSKYASTIIEDKDSLILFSGYLDEESPGRQIINEIRNKVVPIINLEGEAREVKCRVKSYKLSAHVKKNQIVELIARLRPTHTFVVHGDTDNKYKYFNDEKLGKDIYPEMEEILKYIQNCNIIKPKNGEVFKLENI